MRRGREQRTILIFALSAIALIMVVSFAAFSTSLNINGTANISTNWCVGFDNTKTNTYQITKGKSTGTSPTATMGYDGTACSSSYVPIANLGAVFYQPGDKVEYTLTIANKGSIDAVIESITVDGDSVTSNQVVTKGNIIWKVYMPESTTLQATTGTTTMVVSAEFQNTTDLVSYNAHETQTITVGINAIQSNGSNAMTVTPTFTGTIYRNNTVSAGIGDSIVPETLQAWCPIERTNGEVTYNGCEDNFYFNNFNDCSDEILNWDDDGGTYTFSCEQGTATTRGVGDYTTDASTINKAYYLKHDVVNNVITASYVCFVTDTEHCMQGGGYDSTTNISLYNAANKALLQSQEAWFNNNGGSCSFGDDGFSGCYGGGLRSISIEPGGKVNVWGLESVGCVVYADGYSLCGVPTSDGVGNTN